MIDVKETLNSAAERMRWQQCISQRNSLMFVLVVLM